MNVWIRSFGTNNPDIHDFDQVLPFLFACCSFLKNLFGSFSSKLTYNMIGYTLYFTIMKHQRISTIL